MLATEAHSTSMVISLAQVQLYFLALTRILATLIHVPVLGGRTIPNPVKLGLGLLLTAVLVPVVTANQPAGDPAGMPAAGLALAVGREIVVGTLAGFSAALAFGTLQMAGEFMGMSAGFGAGRVINPTFEGSSSALDQLFVMTATLVFLSLNGHHLFLLGLRQTFHLLPLLGPLPDMGAAGLLQATGHMLAVGALLALPVMGASLLADIGLGLLARVAPQVHVFFLGAPIKVAGGMVALLLALGFMLPAAGQILQEIGPRMLTTLGGR